MNGFHWLWWSGALAVCLSLSAWAIIGDRARGRRRCPKCWYDMQGAENERCPECGFEAKSPKQWRLAKRRRKTAALAILIGVGIGVAPFWRPMLLSSIDYLPNTTLILLLNRVEDWQIEQELHDRLIEGDRRHVHRWDRDALWRWQWKLLGDRLQAMSGSRVISSLTDACDHFADGDDFGPMRIRPEEILAVADDTTGQAFGELLERLDLPVGSIIAPRFTDLQVSSMALEDTGGHKCELFLIHGTQAFEIFAVRQFDDDWKFAGRLNVHSKYADPKLRGLEEEPTIVELAPMSTGGTGTAIATTAWLQINEDGLQLIHHWPTSGHLFFSRAPFNYTFRALSTQRGEDERGRFVDHTIQVTISNDGCIWETTLPADHPDIPAVRDLGSVFNRTGVARYRWSERDSKYEFSERESDWTAEQVDDYFYTSDETFLEQNFETLVELSSGDDPARRAWVRLMLTRIGESRSKHRLADTIHP